MPLQYFGNRDKYNAAIAFLNNFYNNGKDKALLITGPPGSGKTHLVDYVAEQCHLEVIMINASDDRTKKSMVHAKNIAMSQGGTPIIVVLDECDNMKSQEIINFINITKVPLFLTCNFVDNIDYKARNLCQTLKINPPASWDFENYIKYQCQQYNIKMDLTEIQKRAAKAKSFRHAERLIFDPNDEDPEKYELQYQTIERMLRGEDIDHVDVKPDELNICVFDVIGDGKFASTIDIVLEHAYLKDYRFWSYAYGALECARSFQKVEPITRTFKMMGEAKKKHKAKTAPEDKAFEKAVEAVKVDVSKISTKVVETGGGMFEGMDIADLGISVTPTFEQSVPQTTTQTEQTDIGDWI